MLEPNLPIAVPVDIDSLDVHAAFTWSVNRFNIDFTGFEFKPPPWEGDLFDED